MKKILYILIAIIFLGFSHNVFASTSYTPTFSGEYTTIGSPIDNTYRAVFFDSNGNNLVNYHLGNGMQFHLGDTGLDNNVVKDYTVLIFQGWCGDNFDFCNSQFPTNYIYKFHNSGSVLTLIPLVVTPTTYFYFANCHFGVNYPVDSNWTIAEHTSTTVKHQGVWAITPLSQVSLIETDNLSKTCPILDGYGDIGWVDISSLQNGSYFISNMGNASYLFFNVVNGVITNTSNLPNLSTTEVTPTCSDGIQNQGETGVDIGGPCSSPTVLDTFDMNFSKPDNTILSDNSNVKTNFYNTKLVLSGTNAYGLYTKILLSIDQNRVHLANATIPVSVSNNTVHDYFNDTFANLKDFYFNGSLNFIEGDQYTFTATYESDLTSDNKIVVTKNIYYNNDLNSVYNVCSTLDIPCYAGNVVRYLFYPQVGFLSTIGSLFTENKDKFPFSLVATMIDTWNSFSLNPSSNLTAITVPFGSQKITLLSSDMLSTSPLAIPVRDTLAIVIWLLTIFALYSRVNNLFNNNINFDR